ncbi:MAG: FAD-binding oxidoreductase [Proteobacteria bacterium]|nr:FAD-binding oxidoreductase [Pseudomonadota bacterium]TDJ34944.1 MAG: FAD-binding oxidoreductase [Gammaproteobacteria bacterium]
MAIERRTFLKGMGSLAAAASVNTLAFGQQQKISVGVVGGGIVGASIALHLAKAGAQVTLFEKTAPAAGATSKSFAWINAFTSDPHYRALRLKSINAYQELDRQLNLNIIWGGAIHWAINLAEAERMKASAAEFDQAGYDARMITPEELAALAPNVRLGPFDAALFSPLDGHMDPVDVTRKMLDAARDRGATIVHPCEVTVLRFKGDRLSGVSTTAGDYSLDRLVIAGGVDTPALAAQAGYTPPLTHAPGILIHTKPTTALVGRVIESPHIYFKQHRDGRIIGTDEAYAPDLPAHQGILEGPQEMPEEIRAMHGERILGKIKDKLPGATDAAYDHLTLGFRPMPQDRLPIVGASPGNSDVYIAVMHSGVTLAAIMGHYISHEIMQDDLIDELAPYRPDRF